MSIPKGFTEINKNKIVGVYYSDGHVVVTGTPITEGEDGFTEEGHNCDLMGCGSLTHIIFRAKINNTVEGF